MCWAECSFVGQVANLQRVVNPLGGLKAKPGSAVDNLPRMAASRNQETSVRNCGADLLGPPVVLAQTRPAGLGGPAQTRGSAPQFLDRKPSLRARKQTCSSTFEVKMSTAACVPARP